MIQQIDQLPGAEATRHLRQRLQGYIARRVRDVHQAEDLLQDVLMKLHIHRKSLPDDPRRRTAWALRTARNAIIDHFRTARRVNASLESIGEPAAGDGDELMNRHPADLARCVASMVGQLPEAYRSAIELADLRQIPQHEVARQLGLSLSGAKSRVQRGRRQLLSMIRECCDVELGRRGSVLSVMPTARAAQFGCSEAHLPQ